MDIKFKKFMGSINLSSKINTGRTSGQNMKPLKRKRN